MRSSKMSRARFADLCTAYESLRTIDTLFGAYDFEPVDDYQGPERGERRTRVASYHAGMDLGDAAVAARLISVYVEALDRWTALGPPISPEVRAFIRGLQRDGIPIDELGRLTSGPAAMLSLSQLNDAVDPRVLGDHLRRIGENIDADPALTIGAAKELVETICRVILADRRIGHPKDAGLKELYKAVANELGLNREAVPGDSPASAAARNALQAMMNVVGSLAEMRNAMGTGHGKSTPSPALARHARMAAHAAQGVGGFLLETWQERGS